jgi:hypothetical protein
VTWNLVLDRDPMIRLLTADLIGEHRARLRQVLEAGAWSASARAECAVGSDGSMSVGTGTNRDSFA